MPTPLMGFFHNLAHFFWMELLKIEGTENSSTVSTHMKYLPPNESQPKNEVAYVKKRVGI